MNTRQLATLIRTARSRIGMASEVIAESRRRIALFHGHEPANKGTRVAVVAPDRDRINVNEDYELRDWAEKFGVSTDELKRAVQQVGDRADAVRQRLGK